MSLISPQINELFTVRIQSYDQGNPAQRWSNNWTLINALGGDLDQLRAAAVKILDFQQALTYSQIVTERAIISTYVRDSNPYNGDEFTAVEFNGQGDRSVSSSNRVPLEVALFLRKATLTGRTGKVFIRGALEESSVEFGQSLFALTSFPAVETVVNTAVISSNLEDLLPSGTDNYKLCLASSTIVSTDIRAVQDMQLAGVRMVNMNKRYYNRG